MLHCHTHFTGHWVRRLNPNRVEVKLKITFSLCDAQILYAFCHVFCRVSPHKLVFNCRLHVATTGATCVSKSPRICRVKGCHGLLGRSRSRSRTRTRGHKFCHQGGADHLLREPHGHGRLLQIGPSVCLVPEHRLPLVRGLYRHFSYI